MSNKKKIIVMSSLVVLLAATAVFNFALANTDSVTSADGVEGVTTANYFTTYRSERTTTRNEELVQLDSVIALYEEGDELVALIHYPPFTQKKEQTHFTKLFEEKGVKKVVFGHIHGAVYFPLKSTLNGLEYLLTSCDKVGFKLIKVY